MKKGLILLGLILATLSCEQEDPELSERRINVFHAVCGDGEETKTVLKEGGQIWWMPEDAIKLFWSETEQGRAGIELVSNNTEPSSSTDFICPASFDGNSASTFWAVYPSNAVDTFLGESIVISIPSQQVAQEGTFANHFFPSIAKSTDTNLQFYNVCGGIKFSVVRDDIRSVSFEGKNNEVLAGKVKLAIGNNGYPEVVEILEGATAITLVAPDNGFFKPGKVYYLSVLPANLNNGFSLRYRTSSQEERLERGDTRIIKRSIFGVLSDIDFNNGVDIEAIDLGLSVKWASVNLGATKPEEYGYYYAWGETEYNKTTYSWTSYKWADGSESSLNKYNTSDNKTNLDLVDDAAHSLLGEDWRIPTKAELDELRQGCTWTRKTKNGVVGYEGVSKRTGNTIFFPMCGVFRDSAIKEIGQTGIYWSSDLTNKKTKAVSLYMMTNKSPQMGEDERRYGYSIRPVSSSGISLNQTSLSLHIGETALLVATVMLSNDADKTVTWTTSNSSVATVVNGAVTAVSVGNAIITAKAGGKSATCNVSVEKEDMIPVTSVTLNKTSLNLKKGQNEVLTATVSPDNATDKSVSWSSSDATVSSVDQNGKVTALKSGNVTITAKAGEKSATCSVTITTPVESVSLDRTSMNLVEGQATTLVATINPNDADEKTIEWTTSNASVAMVSNGVVTAIAEGNAVVTAKAGGKSATCSVTVSSSASLSEVPFEDDTIKRLCLINFDGNHDGKITYVELANVTTIGQVFRGTTGTAFSEFQYFTGVTSLDKEAFSGSMIESLILPESLTIIGDEAFRESKLKEIVIPESVSSIGKSAFARTPLTKADLSRCKITVLSESMMAVTELKEILLPSTLQRIEKDALAYNPNLSKLVIPASVNYISVGALKEDGGIVQLYLQSQEPLKIEKNWMYLWMRQSDYNKLHFNISDQLIVYVPQSAYDTYKSNKYWSSAPLVGYSETE